MRQMRRIALLMGLDLSCTRAMLRGVREFALQRPNWVFRSGAPTEDLLPTLRHWQPHGIISRLHCKKTASRLLRVGKPLVDTGLCVAGIRVPTVDVDHAAVGRLAADYFLARGFLHFGYFGVRSAVYSQVREKSFCRRLVESKCTVSVYRIEYPPQPPTPSHWSVADEQICNWLRELPKPVAIFACNDIRARTIADTCLYLGFHIPGDVALLGVDNDDLECCLTVPPLSSVSVPSERIGYEAASLLDQMIEGELAPQSVFLPPVGVVTRQSTDTMAISDPIVSAAMKFMYERAVQGINVESVVLHVGTSRRELERKFRQIVGSSVLLELRRIRLERAKSLLRGTSLPMSAVARQSGFSTPQRMATVFMQFEKTSPRAYRRQIQR
jgi:LacI family transcriptional regulator